MAFGGQLLANLPGNIAAVSNPLNALSVSTGGMFGGSGGVVQTGAGGAGVQSNSLSGGLSNPNNSYALIALAAYFGYSSYAEYAAAQPAAAAAAEASVASGATTAEAASAATAAGGTAAGTGASAAGTGTLVGEAAGGTVGLTGSGLGTSAGATNAGLGAGVAGSGTISAGEAGMMGVGASGLSGGGSSSTAQPWYQPVSDAFGNPSGNTLGSLASGAVSLYGANQQQQAINAAGAEQRRQFDIGQANQKSWLEAGTKALGAQQELMGLSGTPENQLSALMNSPGYRFRESTGRKAVDAGISARGGMGSGKAGTALNQWGQNFATGEYGNRLNQLAGLSGTGQSQANIGAQQGQQFGSDMGTNTLAGAAARQSGLTGAANAFNSWANPTPAQPTMKFVNGQWTYA